MLAILGPVLAPYSPAKTSPQDQLVLPSLDHPFGTDYLGRDVYSRVLHGGRTTIVIASTATALACIVGFLVGSASAMLPERFNFLVSSWQDAFLALPSLILALVILTILGRGGLALAIAVGASQFAPCLRVARISTQQVLSMEHITAARALGARETRILFRHVFPMLMSSLLAYAAVVFSHSLFSVAGLSYLGLGVEPGTAEWGNMLAEGRQGFRLQPWAAITPGVALAGMIMTINLFAAKIAQRLQSNQP